jgi:hypothetical protein
VSILLIVSFRFSDKLQSFFRPSICCTWESMRWRSFTTPPQLFCAFRRPYCIWSTSFCANSEDGTPKSFPQFTTQKQC